MFNFLYSLPRIPDTQQMIVAHYLCKGTSRTLLIYDTKYNNLSKKKLYRYPRELVGGGVW